MSRLTTTATVSVLQRLAQGFSAWRQRRQEMAELSSMTDRDLADIGVTRGDLASIRKGTYENSRSARQGVLAARTQSPSAVAAPAATQTRIAA
jgi:uncharacterized protein YjiS (DUF1127 family)